MRIKCQEHQLGEFLEYQAQKAQREVLKYAKLRESVRTDTARLRERSQKLEALKNSAGMDAELRQPWLLDRVPLTSQDPTFTTIQVGVTDGGEWTEYHVEKVGIDNPIDSDIAASLVQLANEIKQEGIVDLEPGKESFSLINPPATHTKVREYEALNVNGPREKPRSMITAPLRRPKDCRAGPYIRFSSPSFLGVVKPQHADRKKMKARLAVLKEMAPRDTSDPVATEDTEMMLGEGVEVANTLEDISEVDEDTEAEVNPEAEDSEAADNPLGNLAYRPK